MSAVQEKQPSFSIVIPTLNEEHFLPNLLRDLANQTYKDFEVCVVDAQSDDDTLGVAASFSDRLNIATITSKKRNVSAQRNMGAQQATGDIVIFFDADVRISARFLQGIATRLKKVKQPCLFTSWTKAEDKLPSSIFLANAINTALEIYKIIKKPSAIGAFIGCERQLAVQTLFDEKPKIYEDAFFIQSAIENGGHFYIFKTPQYVFSLRRVKKHGVLKMLIVSIKTNFNYLYGDSFENNDFGYTMEGGKSHLQKELPFFSALTTFIPTATKKQLRQIQSFLKKLPENMQLRNSSTQQ